MKTWLRAAVLLLALFVASGIWNFYSKSSANLHPEKAGDAAPAFRTKTLDGASFQFPMPSSHSSLVVFWASWCGPCAQETPSLIRLAERYKDWNFILISADSTMKDIREFLKIFPGLHRPNIFLIWDSDRSLIKLFGTQAFPESYLFQNDGRLLQKFKGSQNWDSLVLEK